MSIKLIVGLGNPGSQYASTRHNVGSWFVRSLVDKYKCTLVHNDKLYSYISYFSLTELRIRLAIPTTFMNLSGKTVSAIARFYSLSPEEILVVHDDLDLPVGKIKLKFSGGTGGHNGLKNIQQCLGYNTNFYRLRIGIGHPLQRDEVISFVLNKPALEEALLIKHVINIVLSDHEEMLIIDPQKAMTKVNQLNIV